MLSTPLSERLAQFLAKPLSKSLLTLMLGLICVQALGPTLLKTIDRLGNSPEILGQLPFLGFLFGNPADLPRSSWILLGLTGFSLIAPQTPLSIFPYSPNSPTLLVLLALRSMAMAIAYSAAFASGALALQWGRAGLWGEAIAGGLLCPLLLWCSFQGLRSCKNLIFSSPS